MDPTMPDFMPADHAVERDDPARAELLAQADAAIRQRLDGDATAACAFLRHFASGLATQALIARSAEELAGAVLSLWSFAQGREPGRATLRVFNPRSGAGGWRSPHAVIEIVNDDMPFLVESALGVLQTFEQPVQALVHPVVAVARDATGRLLGLDAAGRSESMMQIAFGPQADEGVLAAIAASLTAAMADVRATVSDFEAMCARLAAIAAELPDSAERSFLDWMVRDNFVLLGTRSIDASGTPVAPDEALGLLRDPAVQVFEAARGSELWRQTCEAALGRFDRLAVAKADMRSRVHRPTLCDVVVVKRLDGDGAVIGLHLLLGLFAADAYNRNPRSIPMLRDKVQDILDQAGVDAGGHDGRALRHILDTWPRDDLFQGSSGEILAAARRVLRLQVRPELALFLRQDLFGQHLSAVVFVPRDRFDTALRHHLADMLTRATKGRLAGYAIAMADGPLARAQYLIAADPALARAIDVAALEAAMAQAARSFRERLAEALAGEQGEAQAAATLAEWGDAFPDDYSARMPAAMAVQDIARAAAARDQRRLCLDLLRQPGAADRRLTLKLFHADEPVPLSDIVPLIETLGLRVIEEVPHKLTPRGGVVVLQTLTLETADGAALDIAARGADLRLAIEAVWDGRAEADGFNRLILRAGLSWREAWLLRAMFKWCRQIGAPFSQSAVVDALANHAAAARVLVELFHTRLDPARPRDEADEAALAAQWSGLLDTVASPDEDRILRRLRVLLDAVLRTNFYAVETPVIALKIDSAVAGEMPLPRPLVEIWMHGARMEGCHLRGGRVARGGIRWSDRRDDFRTEILGLMKAQMVKNVVIVPVGAKGGFVLKRPPAATGEAARDREAFAAEGIACYRLLINGMLDVTDNLREGRVVPPPAVIRRDDDDPYLVVAADKGTATFSDTANGIAVERGFWLGDAFASGGSVGYDHKVMGITARGAWVNIAWHFRELGHDIHREDFTCAGVGDMSGDVFGNGLLISPHTRLLAAFDHRHIFLDPAPDPAASHAERARLFALPRSAWSDYRAELISPGGGVFSRQAKTIPLSAPAAAMLDLAPGAHEPAEVMRAILRMRVDLLYFGGIGTYVKAATESQADAGDRANDAIRVDAASLRARVVGEGANLAVTQAGRIEAALAGIRLNTDALDNSAGVSTSDHEVNIKILLADATESGRLSARQRVELLESMTDEVAELVLRDNHQQSQAISLDALGGAADLPAQNALMGLLEAAHILDRAVAGLPDPMAMAARAAAGQALTRPELCTLMAHAKLHLSAVLDIAPLVDDPALADLLVGYFPRPLREGFGAEIARHRLRRELTGTAVTNEMLNRLGAAALGRLGAEAGADLVDVARAALVARAAFDLPAIWAATERLGEAVPVAARLAVLLSARRLHEATTRALLASPAEGSLAEAAGALRPGLMSLSAAAQRAAAASPGARGLVAQGVPVELASFAAALPDLLAAPIVVRIAAAAGHVPVEVAGAAWAGAGEAFAIDPLRAVL
ncbi:MAG: NAD-glutamate dehydrogenase, partial [Rhodospirillales bacterium]|nr:NAD-glutamate dehydrogenase [Rhodospirillales bacterium]